MRFHTLAFADLSDDQLLAEVHRLADAERGATAALIRSLIELDSRPHLYLRDGCSSLFVYCTRVLHLAEGATYNRIEVARAARRFPSMLEALENGSVTLTALRLLAPHLTEANHRNALAAACHKSKSDVEQLIASLRPTPDVPPVIRKLPKRREAAAPLVKEPTPAAADGSAFVPSSLPPPDVPPPTHAAVTPLSTERYKLVLTISGETHEKLRRVQDLLRYAVPRGDLADILDRALTSLLQDLEHRRFAATSTPHAAREAALGSRYIPAAVRRAVWKRDEGQCAFAGQKGRCTERRSSNSITSSRTRWVAVQRSTTFSFAVVRTIVTRRSCSLGPTCRRSCARVNWTGRSGWTNTPRHESLQQGRGSRLVGVE